MGEKDLTQKSLESFPDVFADCINALLYQGKPVLQEAQLLSAPTESTYPDTQNRLHNLFQDVSKYEMANDAIKTQYVIENQTTEDRKMILRKAGYEGAIYRTQYHTKDLYPIISIVLYWGRRRWQEPCSLQELIRNRFSNQELKYINDIKLHIFEMTNLPSEIRQHFHSDMRIVVDLLAEGKNYIPTGQQIVHMEALLRLLRALSADNRYDEMITLLSTREQKENIMSCEFLDAYLNEKLEKGMAKSMAQGMAQGRTEILVANIRSMHQHQLPAETIAELINQQLEYICKIITLFQQYPAKDDSFITNLLLEEKAD